MFASIAAVLAASASVASAASIPAIRSTTSGSASVTPHEQYSSSIGVLGCKVNTNRVAYWPAAVDCNNICLKVSHGDRSVNLLRIDTSGGAFDISYDAWVYLQTGSSAADEPLQGGGVDAQYEHVDASECADLLDEDGALPLSAANSMNFVAACLAEPDSFVAQNHKLVNIQNPTCTLGRDEVCSLDLAVSNQPSCPGVLGDATPLTDLPVENIAYGTGEKSLAL